MALFNQDPLLQAKVVSLNPVFTEEQQASNPLLKKFAKKSKRPIKVEEQSRQSVSSNSTANTAQAKNFQTMAGNSNMTSHPLSNHPFFRQAIDRLCPNLVNLLDTPGKLELKPYWKEALFKKTPFEGCEMREKLEDGVLKVILSVGVQTS